MNVGKIEEQGVIILTPAGRIDSNTALVLEQEIDNIGSSVDDHHLLLDFSSVEYISSAGLRVVLKTAKARQSTPKSFAVSSMKNHVREIFEISGFDTFVAIHPDAVQAMASFV